MARARDCSLDGHTISVKEALQRRNDAMKFRQQYPDFRCLECGNSVRPHKESVGQSAHFEHRKRISKCSRSVASDGR
jgi:hypothetical protein